MAHEEMMTTDRMEALSRMRSPSGEGSEGEGGENVSVSLPDEIAAALDEKVSSEGFDREYWIQAALEEFLTRPGGSAPAGETATPAAPEAV